MAVELPCVEHNTNVSFGTSDLYLCEPTIALLGAISGACVWLFSSDRNPLDTSSWELEDRLEPSGVDHHMASIFQ
jgi:hypothetical protein